MTETTESDITEDEKLEARAFLQTKHDHEQFNQQLSDLVNAYRGAEKLGSAHLYLDAPDANDLVNAGDRAMDRIEHVIAKEYSAVVAKHIE